VKLPLLVPLDCNSIGHFVKDFDIVERNVKFLNEYSNYAYSLKYVPSSRVSNSYFLKLIASHRHVLPHFPNYLIHRLLRRFNSKHRELIEQICDKNIEYLTHWHEQPPLLSPPDIDIEYIRKTIASKINLENPLIILVVRDSGYDLTYQTSKDPSMASRQAYRNTPIIEFRSSIDLLLSRGYSIIRMGRHSNTELNYKSPNYYDYSRDTQTHSDLADVVIPYLAEFTISTGSGVDEFANFYRKPVYRVNVSPPGTLPKSSISKHSLISDYFYEASKKRVSLEQILYSDLNTMNPALLPGKRGIVVKPKGESEILPFVSTIINYEEVILRNRLEENLVRGVPINSQNRNLTCIGSYYY
jgi:putative glycosyltransferase (TIGR04372 family)